MTCEACPIEIVMTERSDGASIALAFCYQCGRIRQYPLEILPFEATVDKFNKLAKDKWGSSNHGLFCYQCNRYIPSEHLKKHYTVIIHKDVKSGFR